MKRKIKPYTFVHPFLAVILMTMISFPACLPVYSEMQSARVVGKGKTEIAPHYTFTEELRENEPMNQEHIAVQFAHGLSDRVDVRARVENVDGHTIIGLGPKFQLDQKGKFALNLIGGASLESETSFQLHPSLIMSIPIVENSIEFTAAPKMIIPICSGCNSFYATNFNLALGKDIRKLAIRPEYGFAFKPGDEDLIGQFSLGISATFGGNGKKSATSTGN